MEHSTLPRQATRLFVSLLFWLGVLVPLIYLLIDPTRYNKDDNFSQFSPVFQYAMEALWSGHMPWMTPVDYGLRLAQAPYYAIFSPIFLLAGSLAQGLQLPAYWTVNFWVLAHSVLVNLVLIRFAKSLKLSIGLQAAVVLSAGAASYMAQCSVNWYYTLPFQLLLVAKIMYWQRFFKAQNSRVDEAILLIASWLAVLSGNPQLLIYTLIVEALFLLLHLNLPVLRALARHALLTGLMLAPFIYCHLMYWSSSRRTVTSQLFIHFFDFISIGFFNPLYGPGPATWIVFCFLLLLAAFKNRKKTTGAVHFHTTLACTAVLLLVAAANNSYTSTIGHWPLFKYFTAPAKWWFFGGIVSVAAVAIWAEQWPSRMQNRFCVLPWISAVVFLAGSQDTAFFLWQGVDYKGAQEAVEILQRHHSDSNSRIYQVSKDRSHERNPSRHLLLNTWLATKWTTPMTWGYESLQPAEAKNDKSVDPFDPLSLKNAGVSALWVNAFEHRPEEFDPGSYQLLYEDDHNFLLRLKNPGRIVTCAAADCSASIHFQADHIDLDFAKPVWGDVTVRVNALSNFTVWADGQKVDQIVTPDGWLGLKATGARSYQIRYTDDAFIVLLIFANLVFLWALVQIKRKRPLLLVKE